MPTSVSCKALSFAVPVGVLLLSAITTARGGGLTGADLTEIVVEAQRIRLSGTPRAASEGTVLGDQLASRPLLRVGEMLEVIPGLSATQHSGDGKANQYFLRGFNLDHGTDFATRVAGVPVNMPTHAHGQGYMDLNFVIPELTDRIVYRKGTYYPEAGNFSAAGAADISYVTRLPVAFASVGAGQYGFRRAVAAGSIDVPGGVLLAGAEVDRSDGPWSAPQDLRKINGVLGWSGGTELRGARATLMAYDNRWTATDQIPQWAVLAGDLQRFDGIDPASGGRSHRYALSAAAHAPAGAGTLRGGAWLMDYGMRLFSNFTYATNPVRGDQFAQFDDRVAVGGDFAWSLPLHLGAGGSTLRTGLDVRHDDIAPVGLYRSQGRVRYATVREDKVRHTMAGLWTGLATNWSSWLRTEAGLRWQQLDFRVRSDNSANSGRGSDQLTAPKFSLALGPWRDTEFFAAIGRGFHSNDVRGATLTVDPDDASCTLDTGCVEQVTPLVSALGSELGVRTALLPNSQLSLSLWRLELDSELLFVGDAGGTEPTRPSRREGIELGIYARPMAGLIVDADVAWSRPRFTDLDPAGNRIPGAVQRIASLGVTGEFGNGWFGGLRVRHRGAAALTEDNSVRSDPSSLLNLQAGIQRGRYRLTAALFNVLSARDHDISYFYASQLPGESQPVEDLHFHPVEPRALRVTLEAHF